MVKLDKVKWGFIGCGEVTEKKSGPAFALIEGSEVVAVMSRDKEKAQSYAKRHNHPIRKKKRTYRRTSTNADNICPSSYNYAK